jgi:hypothetical protein
MKPWHQSGQYLIEKILRKADQLTDCGLKLQLHWAPGHNGAIGIGKAHEAARRATRKGVEMQDPGIRLKSRTLFLGRKLAEKEELDTWRRKYGGRHTFNLDKALPRQHMTTMYNNLSHMEAKALVQLRTGNIALNHFLYRIKAIESPRCSCGQSEETAIHFVFDCPQWETHRQDLRRVLEERWRDFAYAVGAWSGRREIGTRRPVDGPREKWKPNLTVIKAVTRFVLATGRLQPKAWVDYNVEEEGREERSESESERAGGGA